MPFHQLKRRDFITLLGSGAIAWPLAVHAQRPLKPVIGYLSSESQDSDVIRLSPFRQGLNETGYVEGRNVTMEFRWADSHYDRLPELAADLVRRQVTMIVGVGTSLAPLAAKAATTTIPVVFYAGVDPVAVGLVASLNRPGGNLTGVTNLNVELMPKRLELLRELLPAATTIAVLVNATNPSTATIATELQTTARNLGLQLHILNASADLDFDAVFATVPQLKVAGLLIVNDALFTARSAQLAALAARYAVPTIYQYRAFVEAGGLMSYGGNFTDAYRLVGVYTGRILKGEKPAELPVQQSTKVELFINLKSAKALGLTVPTALLVRADEVIE